MSREYPGNVFKMSWKTLELATPDSELSWFQDMGCEKPKSGQFQGKFQDKFQDKNPPVGDSVPRYS